MSKYKGQSSSKSPQLQPEQRSSYDHKLEAWLVFEDLRLQWKRGDPPEFFFGAWVCVAVHYDKSAVITYTPIERHKQRYQRIKEKYLEAMAAKLTAPAQDEDWKKRKDLDGDTQDEIEPVLEKAPF